MARCRAFVYDGLEDFGIFPVETMASGAPVIGLVCWKRVLRVRRAP